MRPTERRVRRARAAATNAVQRDGGRSAPRADEDGLAPGEAVKLLREKEQLEHAMESRPVIDMARGVLMASFACQPEEAWETLVTVSQHTNIKLREVAETVTAAATGTPMPAELQEQLAAAVQAWQAGQERGSPG
ncbi:ANTAR domain-containing protein [Streptomyces sp. NPDC005485]|uniref:ANTAR domain-containing protein n=1 Tax=Streptomyces sp. NPDC005485 TaxID=3155591 RepID=UPI0033A4AC3C